MRKNLFYFFLFLMFFSTACGKKPEIIPYKPESNKEQTEEVAVKNPASVSDALNSETEMVCVSIYGEVANPGIYMLSRGTRVFEAINLAGGVTKEGDVSGLNLVAKLETDGRIYVPVEKGDAKGNSVDNEDYGLPININTASAAELTKLSGIGPSKATDIVSYREKNGDFKTIDDIKAVPGIGDATFEKIRESIRVD